MQSNSRIAGRWLARVLVLSISLYALLLLAVWSDTQYPAQGTTEDTQQHVQLVRSDLDADDGSNSSQHNTSVTSNTATQVSSATMMRTFLDSDGPSTLGIPTFSCLGWRQTGDCSPDGPREPDNDASCSTNIKAGASGYCLLRNEDTGEDVQAMRVNCSSLRDEVRFNCRQAADFARVAPQVDALMSATRQEETPKQEEVAMEPKNGVLMVMYPELLSSVYSTVRLLRSSNCSLPVELWYLEKEMGANPLNDSHLLQSLVNEYDPISLRGIAEGDVDGFNSKVYALAHSELDQHDPQGEVLFLHHNGKKLIGDEEKTRVWTHLQSFVFPDTLASLNSNATERYEYMTTNYHVRIFGGGIFRGFPMCYGDNKMKSEFYRTTSWDDLPYRDLEDRLHDFAQEAGALERSSENQ
ncbi:hypothetical protein PRIC2_004559 [Phytophthora ramorum]